MDYEDHMLPNNLEEEEELKDDSSYVISADGRLGKARDNNFACCPSTDHNIQQERHCKQRDCKYLLKYAVHEARQSRKTPIKIEILDPQTEPQQEGEYRIKAEAL